MANYNAFSRTNYFKVIDESKLEELVAHISSDSTVELWKEKDDDDQPIYGFGAYGCIGDMYDEENGEIQDTAIALQSLLPDGEIAVITEIGYEKLRYLVGVSTIITNKEITTVSLSTATLTAMHSISHCGVRKHNKWCSY